MPIDPNEARAALSDLKLLLSWAAAIVLVALFGWWLSESSPRDEEEDDHMLKANIATYTGETINQLIATVDRVFRRRWLSP